MADEWAYDSSGLACCDLEPEPLHLPYRRILLIIYLHGYMGKESSFQSFPAHIHDFLKVSLDSHVIHTKIYPRYKTYKAIDVARDNFSRWLAPHESPSTDIVLVGHSMGGLLAADTVLLPPRDDSQPDLQRHRHRILGVLALDSPFLGLHPGIIAAGIASLFRKGPDTRDSAAQSPTPDRGGRLSPNPSIYNEQVMDMTPLDTPESSTSALSYFASNHTLSLQPTKSSNSNLDGVGPAKSGPDPYYNPPFFNDIMLKDRHWMKSMWHFAKKRKGEGSSLIEAATNHVVCHLQFGKCLAKKDDLLVRYEAIRRLEDVNDLSDQSDQSSSSGSGSGSDRYRPSRPARVRFANYYTISTGRIKTPKPRSPAHSTSRSPARSTGRSPTETPPRSPSVRPKSPSVQRPGSSDTPRGQHHSLENRRPPSVAYLRAEQPIGIRSPDLLDSRSSTPRISVEDHSDIARPKLLEIICSDNFDAVPKAPLGSPYSPGQLTTAESSETTTGSSVPGDRGTPVPNPTSRPVTPVEQGVATDEANSADDLEHDLKPIPDLPEAPRAPELAPDADEGQRRQAEKEHKRALKDYDHAIKAREKIIRERDKTIDKRRRNLEKEAKKKEKDEQKRLHREERKRQKEQPMKEADRKNEPAEQERGLQPPREIDERENDHEEPPQDPKEAAAENLALRQAAAGVVSGARGDHFNQNQGSGGELGGTTAEEDLELRRAAEMVVAGTDDRARHEQERGESDGGLARPPGRRKKKLRKFCTLPRKVNGVRDPAWVEVFMDGVDEIGAHVGLFTPAAPHYERLVGDVGSRILAWVQEDASRRTILAESA